MIVLDALDPTYGEIAFTGKTWPQAPWNSLHILYTFQAYGSATSSPGNDYNKASAFVASGDYALAAGTNFTAADYVSPDFESWPVTTSSCPHDGAFVPTDNWNPPYNTLDNINQTSIDTRPQTSGKYTFYNWGPMNGEYDSANPCYEPVFSQDNDYFIPSGYITWPNYPEAGRETVTENLLERVQSRAQQSQKYLTAKQAFFNTSFMYIDTATENPAGIAAPIATAEWRKICRHIFHFCNGMSLWYHRATQGAGGYVIAWSDPGVQANVDIIQEEYDKLWTNMIVGSIA